MTELWKPYSLSLDPNPSISVSNYVSILSETSDSPLDLAKASISSKNTIHGLIYFALWKISLIFFSESPTYLLKISGPLIEIKFIYDSWAKALANIVLEHPGGPYNNIPLGNFKPLYINISGFFKGNYIVVYNRSLVD